MLIHRKAKLCAQFLNDLSGIRFGSNYKVVHLQICICY